MATGWYRGVRDGGTVIAVLVYRTHPVTSWCVLRHATPGDRIATLCASALPYTPVHLQTIDLADHDMVPPRDRCPACWRELAAKTPGAAVCMEPRNPTLESRVSTVDLRPGRGGEREADEEWSETGIPEVAIEEMLSRPARRCCARMQYGDGAHDLSCSAVRR